MDFLVFCFETRWNCGGEHTVTAINSVLEDENIGYELTQISYIPIEGESYLFGTYGPKTKGARRIVPPQAIKKDEKTTHKEIIRPCLHVLSDSRFATANDELLRAFDNMRNQNWPDAITWFCSSFESVLKTICSIKKWPYDRDRDTCSKLVEICQQNNLFPGFYRLNLESVGTIRNKAGSSHGRGPAPEVKATKELALHMERLTCTQILFVIDQM
jgi:hypothetical protein